MTPVTVSMDVPTDRANKAPPAGVRQFLAHAHADVSGVSSVRA